MGQLDKPLGERPSHGIWPYLATLGIAKSSN